MASSSSSTDSKATGAEWLGGTEDGGVTKVFGESVPLVAPYLKFCWRGPGLVRCRWDRNGFLEISAFAGSHASCERAAESGGNE